MATETSQTLDRGLQVLAALARTPEGLTFTELATAVGVNRTVVYRLASTLEKHALLRRDRRGRLYVGLGVLPLATAVQPVLRDAAGPVLRALAERLGCTAHFTVVDGEEALALSVVEPSWPDFHVGYRVGARHPLDRGAAGRAILLGRGDQRSRATSDVAHRGDPEPSYVATSGELQPGARGLAAPVRGVEGLEASVGIVTLSDLDVDELGPVVTAAAQQLASRLV